MKRRDFMACTLAGVGGLLVQSGCKPQKWLVSKKYDPYEMVSLGKTGIRLSRVGMGTGSFGGGRESNQVRLGKERFQAMVRGAFERGIRWFDCADMYGSNPHIIPALKGIPRDKYFISSKIWWYQEGGLPEKERPSADRVVERFLKEIKTDYIDMVLLHFVFFSHWPDDLGDSMNKLARLKQKGIIRAHGVSCHTLEALEACVNESWVDSVHARINPYAEMMDVEKVEDVPKVVSVLNAIHEQGKGVVGMKIIGGGQFGYSDEKRNRSIEFALNLGCVDTMTVGFMSVGEMDDFAERVRRTPVRSADSAGRSS